MENQSPALSMEYKVDFNNGNGKHKSKKATQTPIPKIPRVTKLLALAHHLKDLLDQGVVKDYADIARLSGLSRARVSQIMNLTLLAPEIQEKILFFQINTTFTLTEQTVRKILNFPVWKKQVTTWSKLTAHSMIN